MNDKPLKPKRNISPFFYENKLYEFSQKTLSEVDRAEMKKLIKIQPDAKQGIGSVLLSLEYLSKLSEVELEIKEIDYERLGRRTRIAHVVNILFFLAMTLIFTLSGYYLANKYLAGAFG